MSFWAMLRNRLIPESLRAKTILGVGIILLTVMGAFNYLAIVTQVKRLTDENRKMALEISNTVIKGIEYPMLEGDMDNVQAILERLGTLEDLKVVHLCDENGIIRHNGTARYDVGRKAISQVTFEALRIGKLAHGLEKHHFDSASVEILRYAIPIHNEKACYKCHGSEKPILGVLSVGFSREPIRKMLASARGQNLFLAVVSVSVVVFFLTLWLNRYIVRPLARLTGVADEISWGKYVPGSGKFPRRAVHCWELLNCDKGDCPAYARGSIPCWYVSDTLCFGEPSGKFPEKIQQCVECTVYKRHKGDEIVKLQDAFRHMLHKLSAYEKELRVSEEKYRLLFNANPDPIFIIDRDKFQILDVNERTLERYGYSREELLEMSFDNLGHKPTGEVISGFKELSPGQCGFFTKKRHTHKDGRSFYVNITVCPARYMGMDALIVATTDITESVEKEAQLIQAGKMTTIGTMASGIAHELNQPLNVLKIGSDFLLKMIRRREKIDIEELKIVAEEISGHVDRASGIINHLREFSRVSTPVRSLMDINKPIQDVFKVLGQQLRLHQVEIKLDLAKDLPPIMADHNRLEQVFINMVTNALDAIDEKVEKMGTEAGGMSITIKSFLEDGRVVVVVSDTGIGIPDHIKDKIFEPFFTTKEVGRGTGLGMSISYGIVRDYGGTIDLKSEAGLGTTFELRFPVHSKTSEN
ncbi:MAG: ATP-binding protein [Desulfovibrionales bacterium]|nr:ATP-binding protein [Desulfovibrionales bacterium]